MSFFPEYVLALLRRLESCGFEAYAVGGCVRDFLINRTPNDYDIATNALPGQIKEIFAKFETVTIGEQHGTIGVVTEKHLVEITTYRIDGNYLDSRRPSQVSFSRNLTEDLRRRDFTVNAMAMDKDGNIIDFFGGRQDIEKKIIRAVGDPVARLKEDALRIMRCIRFSSQLGFAIEGELSFAVESCKGLLKKISAERIREEFVKLLCGGNCTETLRAYRSVIEVFIPEIRAMYNFDQHTRYHRFDVWEHTIHAVGIGRNEPLLRTALFFHDIAKPDCFTLDEDGTGHFKGHAPLSAQKAETIMKRLRFSSKDISFVKKLVANHRRSYNTDSEIKHVMNRIGVENFLQLIDLKRADDSAKGYCDEKRLNQLELAQKRAEEIRDSGECYRLKDMKINGSDVASLGVTGKRIGELLQLLLDKIIDGELENRKDMLINYLVSII